ncbi:hypothetical protein M413DRAFT_278575 [Hebeloma cylindrosporum]|uniref:Uncharacterized protein n=1 Tax=Hebeloma cylindrosporum TaxID=76867 RepID=A0A0C3BYP9_HEBCY|nr:hypothetical protein M413DRAFT_278575 [Hebeloma cylindrosporum h7]
MTFWSATTSSIPHRMIMASCIMGFTTLIAVANSGSPKLLENNTSPTAPRNGKAGEARISEWEKGFVVLTFDG